MLSSLLEFSRQTADTETDHKRTARDLKQTKIEKKNIPERQTIDSFSKSKQKKGKKKKQNKTKLKMRYKRWK